MLQKFMAYFGDIFLANMGVGVVKIVFNRNQSEAKQYDFRINCLQNLRKRKLK